MTIRFCPTCQSNVKVEDGYCLLGHSIRLEPMNQTLTELRAEVDAAFEEVNHVFDEAREVIYGQAPVPPVAPPAPAVQAQPAPIPPTTFASVATAVAPVQIQAAEATVAVAPPAPTAPVAQPGQAAEHVRRPTYADLWKSLENEAPTTKDPIAGFAPAPRMDWGPERTLRIKRPSLRRNRDS